MFEKGGMTRRQIMAGSGTLGAWLALGSRLRAASAQDNAVRIGLIGCPTGDAGRDQSVLDDTAGVMDQLGMVVTHVWDVDGDRAADYAKTMSIPNVVDRFDGMVQKVDGVFVNDPRAVSWHPRLAQPYLRAGMPVWIDGPLTYSVSSARKMIGDAERGKTALMAATVEEFLPLTHLLHRKVAELGPLTAAMAVVSTLDRPGNKWAGVEGVNIGVAIFGAKARKISRIVASEKEPNYALTLEYAGLPKDRPVHVVVQGVPVETDRVWARLYGVDMVDVRHVFSDNAREDWLSTFLPAALAMQRAFTSKEPPQSHDHLLEKTRLYIASCKSSLVPDGKQLSLSDLEDAWEADNPHPGHIPDGVFS